MNAPRHARPTTREIRAALDEIAQALQVASPLSTTLRRLVGDAAQQALDLEAAIDRAARALRRLRPDREDGSGP